jgi:hypothetical protein
LLHFKCAEEAADAAGIGIGADGTGLLELGDEDEDVFFTILAQDIG